MIIIFLPCSLWRKLMFRSFVYASKWSDVYSLQKLIAKGWRLLSENIWIKVLVIKVFRWWVNVKWFLFVPRKLNLPWLIQRLMLSMLWSILWDIQQWRPYYRLILWKLLPLLWFRRLCLTLLIQFGQLFILFSYFFIKSLCSIFPFNQFFLKKFLFNFWGF